MLGELLKQIEVNSVIERDTAVITIAGLRGYGKTYLTSKLIEQEQGKGHKIFVFDVVGALSKYLGYDFVLFDKVYGKKTAKRLLDKLDKQQVVIFNISELTREEMVAQADVILSVLMSGNDHGVVVIDEVGELIPQRHEFYSNEVERLIRIGRNKGLGKVYMTTQRLQQTDKTAISQSSYYFFFKMLHNLDIEAVRSILGWDSKEIRELKGVLSNLEVGEFVATDGIFLDGIFKWVNSQESVVKVRSITSQTKLTDLDKTQHKQHRGKLKGKEEEILKLRKEGWTYTKLAQTYGVNATAIWKLVKKHSKKKGKKGGK